MVIEIGVQVHGLVGYSILYIEDNISYAKHRIQNEGFKLGVQPEGMV